MQTGEDGPTETSPATTPFILEDDVVAVDSTEDVAVEVVVGVKFDVAVVVV